jgi:hypothetical protein
MFFVNFAFKKVKALSFFLIKKKQKIKNERLLPAKLHGIAFVQALRAASKLAYKTDS